MANQTVFKPWMPDWAVKGVLIFCMLHSMVLLGLYTSNTTYSASFLDVEVEDLQYAMSLTYGTFLATILIESRLFKYFPTRNYFMAIYFLAAVSFIISAYTHDYVLFIILRMVEGVLMALPWIPLRLLLLSRFKSKNAIIIVFSLTYGTLLIASPFIMNIVVWLLENYDWKYMAYGSAFFQLICVALVLITFNGHRFHKKTPLYQVDWASYVLVHTAIICGAFVLIYGEKKYWFQSSQITLATAITAVSSGLFLVRQLLVKRPCFDLKVFHYANLRTGLVLFVLFYISRASLNICHTTMSKVWNWEPVRVANIQYLNALGDLIGIFIAAILLSKAVATRYIFILGFSLMAVYHLWFTFLFVPDVSLADIVLPYILQGVAVGILFVPLVLFTVSSVPAYLAPFSGTVGVTGRFWGSTIGFCVMQNAQVFLEQKHYSKFRETIIPERPEIQEQISRYTQKFQGKGFSLDEASTLAMQQITAGLKKQGVLLSNMEIFTAIGFGLIVLVVLLIFNRHLRQTFDIFKNRIWGS
ncbi:MFS transporter [Pedobacter sp. PACM 27299]|uniref:MFS transporter n=1 Tax=Pedobacter sp. PACM 27299 TaxID=1727164 RepID=UPI00070653EE|nr:MFS transporter [Pedobacter sp. PACM 27299]ALL08782.1 MFS transporter [Pedobacter sp. PACM 27299]